MMLEIMNVLSNALLFGFTIIIIYVIFSRTMKGFKENQSLYWKCMICFSLSFFILFATLMVMIIDVYQVAVSLIGTNIQPWVESLIYLCLQSLGMMVCLVSISFLWKNVYDKQLIPGEGTVKERLVQNFNLFKKSFRRKK